MDSNEVPEMNTMIFHVTMEQAEKIANHFGKDLNFLNEVDICELLDTIIDEL